MIVLTAVKIWALDICGKHPISVGTKDYLWEKPLILVVGQHFNMHHNLSPDIYEAICLGRTSAHKAARKFSQVAPLNSLREHPSAFNKVITPS